MKKIIALTIVLIMAVTSTVFADLKAAQEDLTKNGIITDYTLENINRGEAAKIIATMLGHQKLDRADTVFSDVPSEYWASGYIDFANQNGIINGNGDGTFAPEEKVTNEQMVKMLVCALGYEPKVRGEYPVAHFMTASEIGIISGLDLVGTDIAKREDVAVMVHNAMDVPIMVQMSFGSFSQYAIMDGTAGTNLITLRSKLYGEDYSQNQVQVPAQTDEVPRFNGPEYSGLLARISELNKGEDVITFKNSLNDKDKATYIVDDNTYVYISENTLPLEDVKNGLYAQCWYRIDEKDNIHILKIELMAKDPVMAN